MNTITPSIKITAEQPQQQKNVQKITAPKISETKLRPLDEDRFDYSMNDGIKYSVKYRLKGYAKGFKGLFFKKQNSELEAKMKYFTKQKKESFYRAQSLLDSKKLKYDPIELTNVPGHILECIGENRFSINDMVLGHGNAAWINDAVRKDQDGGIWQVINDEGFKQLKPTEKPMVAYRAVSGESGKKANLEFVKNLIKLKEGDVFTDKAYSYSSLNKEHSTPFSGGNCDAPDYLRADLTVNIPAGAKISKYKGECLFPRDSKFKILEPAELNDKGIYEIQAEYILPN